MTRIIIFALAILLGACSAPAPFNASEVPKLTYGHGVELRDTEGKTHRIEEFRGRVTLLFFGFTRCPDVCPSMLLRLKKVRDATGPLAPTVQVVLLSVDPERDTPDILRAYVKHFDPSFMALRPEPAQLEQTLKEFRAIAIRVPTADGTDYTVDHSATIFVYDRSGALRLIAQPQLEVEKLAADVTRLARE